MRTATAGCSISGGGITTSRTALARTPCQKFPYRIPCTPRSRLKGPDDAGVHDPFTLLGVMLGTVPNWAGVYEPDTLWAHLTPCYTTPRTHTHRAGRLHTGSE